MNNEGIYRYEGDCDNWYDDIELKNAMSEIKIMKYLNCKEFLIFRWISLFMYLRCESFEKKMLK